MSGYRIPGALACCLLTAALAGCGLFREYRPVTIQVIDGETRQPLPGAEVSVSYPNMLDFTAPTPVSGVTDGRGAVTLEVGEYCNKQLSAERAAYSQVGRVVLRPGFIAALPREASRRDVHYILELWADPNPVVEFVIPPGYRGPIKARFEPANSQDFQPGQRVFQCRIDEAGRVTVKAPKLVDGNSHSTKFAARCEGGNLLPEGRDSKPDEVALRSVNSGYPNQLTRLFIIGTQVEADALHERTIRRLAPNHIQSDHDAYNRVFDE